MKPRILISSICYNLNSIEKDLANLIEAYGFEPMILENVEIGYNLGKSLEESYYEAINFADTIVLVIGDDRSGFDMNQNQEIKEYISAISEKLGNAAASGIPIYSFIEKNECSEHGTFDIEQIKSLGTSLTEFGSYCQIKDFLMTKWADLFKNYIKYLKEEDQMRPFQDCVYRIDYMIEEMWIRIDGAGKKVSEDNDKFKHEQALMI